MIEQLKATMSQIGKQLLDQADQLKEKDGAINELINTVNESRDLQAQHITTLKESHDTASQLIDCYEKLLKIRREKNNKVDAPEKTKIVIEAIKS